MFYQELSMLFSELPRSNAVKNARTELNHIPWSSFALRDMKVLIERLKVLCANTCQHW